MPKLRNPYWTVPEHPSLEIYVAELGHIVLKQRAFDGEERCVFVEPRDVPLLCHQLDAAAAEANRLQTAP